MSFFSPPSAPNPVQSSNQQLDYNQQAATQQQQTNMINQQTPFGSLNYTADPNAPGGYSANLSLTAAQQQLLSEQQGTRSALGGAGQNLAQNVAGMYSQAPNIDPSQLTNQMMGWGQQYMQPIFNQQQSNLNAQLQNQGITPGSEAWNNAQNLQSRNVNNAYSNLFMQAEPQAFQQAVTQYQLPGQEAMSLMGASAPQQPNLVSTPTAQVGAPNYQQAAQNQYAAQQQQYQNLMGGLGQAAGIIAAPFTGGLSMIPGMFGGAMSSGTYGGTGGGLGGLY